MTITEQVRAARAYVGEDTATFGARWHRSGRTVEDWEQGRRRPDPLVIEALREMTAFIAEEKARSTKTKKKKAG